MREGQRRRPVASDGSDADARSLPCASDLTIVMPEKTVEWLKPGGSARLDLDTVGPAQLLRVQASPLRIASFGDRGPAPPEGSEHEPAQPTQADRTACLHLALHGVGRSVYSDEATDESLLGTGAMVLIDGARPCAAVYPDGARLSVWSLPRAMLEPGLPDLPPAAALDGEAARLVAAQASLAGARASRLPAPLRRALIDHLCQLIALAFACSDARVVALRAAQAAGRRARVRAYLEGRFRDSRLCVERAARDLGMSRRWLQAQFPSGSGFADALARRRLEASLALLRDPATAHLTVTEIAFASGFNDLSTFHRRFRRHYGLTPRAARTAQCSGRSAT